MRRHSVLLALGFVAAFASMQVRAQVNELPAVSLEYAGAYSKGMQGGAHFSLHIFADGLVIYQGERNVRVNGAARTEVPPETVARWTRQLQDGGFDKQGNGPISADASWYRLTVQRDGIGKSVNFMRGNSTHYLSVVAEEILKTIRPFERWVERR